MGYSVESSCWQNNIEFAKGSYKPEISKYVVYELIHSTNMLYINTWYSGGSKTILYRCLCKLQWSIIISINTFLGLLSCISVYDRFPL